MPNIPLNSEVLARIRLRLERLYHNPHNTSMNTTESTPNEKLKQKLISPAIRRIPTVYRQMRRSKHQYENEIDCHGVPYINVRKKKKQRVRHNSCKEEDNDGSCSDSDNRNIDRNNNSNDIM